MKKLIIIIIMIFFNQSIHSQNQHNGLIFLKDGEIVKGDFQWLTSIGSKSHGVERKRRNVSIKYECNKNLSKIREYYNHKDGIDSVQFHCKKYNSQYFLIFQINENEKNKKVDLFSHEETKVSHINGSILENSRTNYYISKSGYNILEKLPRRKTGKKFKSILTKYFPDCIELKNKLNDNTYLKNTTIIDFIKDCNSMCKS